MAEGEQGDLDDRLREWGRGELTASQQDLKEAEAAAGDLLASELNPCLRDAEYEVRRERQARASTERRLVTVRALLQRLRPERVALHLVSEIERLERELASR